MRAIEFGVILFVAVMFAVAQNSLVGLPFVWWVIYFYSKREKYQSLVMLSFIVGLIADALAFRVIGISSLYYLVLTFLLYLLREQFSLNRVFEGGLFLLGGGVWFLLFGESNGAMSVFWFLLLSLGLFFISSKIVVRNDLVLSKSK